MGEPLCARGTATQRVAGAVPQEIPGWGGPATWPAGRFPTLGGRPTSDLRACAQRPRPACEADLGFGPGATASPSVRHTAVCGGRGQCSRDDPITGCASSFAGGQTPVLRRGSPPHRPPGARTGVGDARLRGELHPGLPPKPGPTKAPPDAATGLPADPLGQGPQQDPGGQAAQGPGLRPQLLRHDLPLSGPKVQRGGLARQMDAGRPAEDQRPKGRWKGVIRAGTAGPGRALWLALVEDPGRAPWLALGEPQTSCFPFRTAHPLLPCRPQSCELSPLPLCALSTSRVPKPKHSTNIERLL